MSYNFLQVASDFTEFFEKNIANHGNLEANEFYQKFSHDSKKGIEDFLMKLPINLINFLRDLNAIIYNSDPNAGISSSGPIKGLFILRFLISPETRLYIGKPKVDDQNFLKAANYFKVINKFIKLTYV